MSWTLKTTAGTLTWDDGEFTGDTFPLELVTRLVRRGQQVPTFAQGPFVVASADEGWIAAATARAALDLFLVDSEWTDEPPFPAGLLTVDPGALA